MNFRLEHHEERAGLPITPMLDVIFLLLIFFMTTSIYAQLEEEIGIVVPTATEAVPPDRTPGEIIINIAERIPLLSAACVHCHHLESPSEN